MMRKPRRKIDAALKAKIALDALREQASPLILITQPLTAESQRRSSPTTREARDLLLVAVMAASVLSLITVPLSGHLSDRFGRRRVYMWGAALTGLYGFIYVALLNTTQPLLVFVAIFVSLIPRDIMYGPQAALIAECFPGRLRYSGASIGYQLASVIAGGPAPLIVAWLLAEYKSGWVIAGFILACAVISLVATAMLPDNTNKEIAEDYQAAEKGAEDR